MDQLSPRSYLVSPSVHVFWVVEQISGMLVKAGGKETDVKGCDWTPKGVIALGAKFEEALERSNAELSAQFGRQEATLEEKDEMIHSLEAQLADLNARFLSQQEALAAMSINLDEHDSVVRKVKAERDE